MGIDVYLIDENGKVAGTVSDLFNRIPGLVSIMRDPSSTHCLQYIDRYGDTVFNALQIDRFLEEWETVESNVFTSEDREMAAAVKTLAREGLRGPHMYLKFIGD